MPDVPLVVFKKNEFKTTGIHLGGYSGGELFERLSDGKKFLSKGGAVDLVATEYIMGGIYKALLGKHAPEIIFIKDDGGKSTIGSWWFENLETLKTACQKNKNPQASSYLEINDNSLEQIIVISALCGEDDFNLSNIGLVRNPNGSLSVKRYDFAFSMNYINEKSIWRYIKDIINLEDEMSSLSINSDSLLEKLRQMTTLNITELTTIIDQRVDCLQHAGFDFNGRTAGHNPLDDKKRELFLERKEKNPNLNRYEVMLTAVEVKEAYRELIIHNFNSLKKSTDQIIEAINRLALDRTKEDWLITNQQEINSVEISTVDILSQVTQELSSLLVPEETGEMLTATELVFSNSQGVVADITHAS